MKNINIFSGDECKYKKLIVVKGEYTLLNDLMYYFCKYSYISYIYIN